MSFPYFPSTSYRGNFCLSTVLLFHAERVTQIMYICWVYHVNDSIVAQSNGFVFFCRLVIPTCGTLCQCETLLQPYHPFLLLEATSLRLLQRKETTTAGVEPQVFSVAALSRSLFQSYENVYFQFQAYANGLSWIVPAIRLCDSCFRYLWSCLWWYLSTDIMCLCFIRSLLLDTPWCDELSIYLRSVTVLKFPVYFSNRKSEL